MSWFDTILKANQFGIPEGTPTITLTDTKFLATYDGNDADADGWYGRCSVVRRADGVLLLTYKEGGAHTAEEFAVIHLRFSGDNGETWSDEDEYLDGTPIDGFPLRPTGAGSGNTRGPVHGPLTLCPNGDILCHMWSSNYGDAVGDNDGAHQSRSTDGGLTWDASVQIIFADYGGEQDKTFFSEGRVVVGDTIYAPIRYAIDQSPYAEENHMAISTDNGETWTVISQVTTDLSPPTRGTGEMSIEYVGDGCFISLLRGASNENGYYVYSIDWCVTWSSPVDITSDFGIGATEWLGRTQIYTRAHLQRKSNWWNDRLLVISGFVGGVDEESAGARRNFASVGIIPEDRDLSNITWYPVTYLDSVGHDGGYGDHFYNDDTDEYVFCSYRAPTSLYDGSVKQYNFTLTFE